MKKLLIHSLFVLLTAALLMTVALVTSCDGFVGKIIQETEKDDFIPYDPPAGMGYIRIKLKNAARTISPDLPAPSGLDYRIEIFNSSSISVYDSDSHNGGAPVEYDDLAALAIALTPGTGYKVNVTAYNRGNTTDVIGADEVTGVAILAGVPKTVDVFLKPQITATTGFGKFSYKIALPTNAGSATGTFTAVLDVKTYPAKDPTILANIDLMTSANLNNTASPATLPSGFYYLTITMTDPGVAEVPAIPGPAAPAIPPALQNRTIASILQIYDNMTTNYGTSSTAEQLADLNVFSYSVTYNKGSANTLTGTTSFGPLAHGSTLTRASQAPNTPTYPGNVYPFGYWSRTPSATSTSKWFFTEDGTPTKLISNIDLYPIFLSDVSVSLDIDWDDPSLPVLSSGSATFYQDKYYNGVAQTVTVTVSGLGDYSIDGNWKYGDTDLGSTTLTLNNSSNTDYFSVGTHKFYLYISKSGDSQNFVFTLTVAAVTPVGP